MSVKDDKFEFGGFSFFKHIDISNNFDQCFHTFKHIPNDQGKPIVKVYLE